MALAQVERVVEANGDALRRERELRGYSLRDLAERSGVTQDNIWKIEHGKTKRPHGRTLRRLAEAMGIEARELMHEPGRAPEVQD